MRIFNISGVSNTSNIQKPNFGMLRTDHIQIFEKTRLTPSNINMIKDKTMTEVYIFLNIWFDFTRLQIYKKVGSQWKTYFKFDV